MTKLATCLMAALLTAQTSGVAEAERQPSAGWRAVASAPAAKRIPIQKTEFGESRIDEYAWLRADNWQDAVREPRKLPAEIRRHLDAENRYARRTLAPLRSSQARLTAEMRGRIEPAWSTPPAPDGAWAYFERHVAGKEHPVLWRKPRRGGTGAPILDTNRLARGASSFDFAGARHSPDHSVLAYALDKSGTEDFTIRFRDLTSGRDLPDEIRSAEGVPHWAADSRTVFYARREGGRALTVLRHALGTPTDADAVVYREANPAFLLSLNQTTSGRFLVITAADSRTQEVHAVSTDRPDEPPRVLVGRRDGERHAVEHHGDRFIIKTSSGNAPDFRIVETPVASPGQSDWRVVVPHREGTSLHAMQVTARHLARIERREGRDAIVIRRLADGAEHTVSFPDEPYAIALEASLEFDTDTLRFTHETMRHPRRTIDYDMEARRQRVVRTDRVPSGHDPRRYASERRFAPASDGERIPVSLLYRKGLRLGGRPPLLLHAYGAYGDATDAAFDPNVLSLVDRGYVYAIAHVRGGNEMGERWREGGVLDKKLNSFRDFIAVAEHLAEAGYTRRGRIVASGFSAGGLLVAGVANMRPDLFMGVIALSPFVDALNTMLDPSLPLTPTEWNEWGNPIESRAAFDAIRAYSPYDNVKAQAYPAMFVTASLTDPRVTYWEPAKWVARLRATKTDPNPVLLLVQERVGHEGPTGRFEKLEEKAQTFAFALKLAQSTPPVAGRGHRQPARSRPAADPLQQKSKLPTRLRRAPAGP